MLARSPGLDFDHSKLGRSAACRITRTGDDTEVFIRDGARSGRFSWEEDDRISPLPLPDLHTPGRLAGVMR
jgi:hypothetical protein